MHLTVAGKDRSSDLGAELSALSVEIHDDGLEGLLDGEQKILALRDACCAEEYLEGHIDLLRLRRNVDPLLFFAPTVPGWKGKILGPVKRVLLRMATPRLRWLFRMQSTINDALAAELEFEHQARRSETAALRARSLGSGCMRILR